MKHVAFSLEQLATPPIQHVANLTKGDFLVIRRGPHDLAALKRAAAKFKKVSAGIKPNPSFDVVAEVRKYRDGIAS